MTHTRLNAVAADQPPYPDALHEAPPFELHTRELGESAAVVSVRGELDLIGAPELSLALQHLTERGFVSIVVGLTDTAFIDSQGIHALLDARHRLAERHGGLSLACPNPLLRRLFELARLEQVWMIRDTVDELIDRRDSEAHRRLIGPHAVAESSSP